MTNMHRISKLCKLKKTRHMRRMWKCICGGRLWQCVVVGLDTLISRSGIHRFIPFQQMRINGGSALEALEVRQRRRHSLQKGANQNFKVGVSVRVTQTISLERN